MKNKTNTTTNVQPHTNHYDDGNNTTKKGPFFAIRKPILFIKKWA